MVANVGLRGLWPLENRQVCTRRIRVDFLLPGKGHEIPYPVRLLVLRWAGQAFPKGRRRRGAIVLALIVFFQFAVPMLGHIASIISMRFFGIDAETYRQMNQNAPVGERVESGSKL